MEKNSTKSGKLGKITLQDVAEADAGVVRAALDVCSVEIANRAAGRNLRVQLDPETSIEKIADWKTKADAYDRMMLNRDDD